MKLFQFQELFHERSLECATSMEINTTLLESSKSVALDDKNERGL